MTGQTLVTGADGYLGRRIAARLLAETDDRLVLAVRAADDGELSAKRVALLAELGLPSGTRRADVVACDLREPAPFAAVDGRGLTGIVHSAARTAFNVERSTAHDVNVGGTRKVAAFARGCPRLQRLLVLSTLFSAGRTMGTVAEVPHAGDSGFVNHYEWSKYEAEHVVLSACADLPLSVARLATIVADDESGAVTQYNAFHNTMRLFFYGLLSLLPGDRSTPLYLATADFTSAGVAHLLRPRTPGGIYHLVPGTDDTITLAETIDIAFGIFEEDPGYRRRRLLRPEFCDLESFRSLVEASRVMTASPLGQAVASIAPFAEQLFLPKSFDNSRLRATWSDDTAPPPHKLTAATCEHLVRTRWGRTTPENGAV